MPTIVTSGTRKFIPNFLPTAQTYESVLALRDLLLACGWSVLAHSDGTVNSAGDFGTDSDLNNNNAWLHLQSPNGHDMVWQRGTLGHYWRAYYCDVALGGGVGATRPSHADEIQIVGNGGLYNTQWGANIASDVRYHFHADGEAANGVSGFSIMCRNVAGGAHRNLCAVESFSEIFANGVDGVPDEAKWAVTKGSILPTWNLWLLRNRPGETLLTSADSIQLPVSIPFPTGGTNPNKYSGLYQYIRLLIGEVSGGNRHIKGKAQNFMWAPSTALGNGDTINLTTDGGAFIKWGNIMIPWPHNIAPVI